MPYSVSPRRKLAMVGLNPSWNLSTRMPTRFAARKWPSSCTNTSTPRTKANARRVVNPGTSDFQFYRARDLLRIIARPAIERAYLVEPAHLCRLVRIHRGFDDSWNRREANPPFQESFHGDLVRGIQHNREAALGRKRTVRQAETLKCIGVWRVKLEMSGTSQI